MNWDRIEKGEKKGKLITHQILKHDLNIHKEAQRSFYWTSTWLEIRIMSMLWLAAMTGFLGKI